MKSRVAQWKRAGPITQRSEDQNLALLHCFIVLFLCCCFFFVFFFVCLFLLLLYWCGFKIDITIAERFFFKNSISNIWRTLLSRMTFSLMQMTVKTSEITLQYIIYLFNSRKQSCAVEACWAHNPEVRGSKPRSATLFVVLDNTFTI